MTDELENFLNWFLQAPMSALRTPFLAVTNFGTVVSMVLYRNGQYQVELIISPPGQEGFETPHRHPSVDSFVVHLSGDIRFMVNGKPDNTDEVRREPGPDGLSKVFGFRSRLRGTDWHSATISKKGGSFLSVQKWADGVTPTSVGLDWDGVPTSPEQAALQVAL